MIDSVIDMLKHLHADNDIKTFVLEIANIARLITNIQFFFLRMDFGHINKGFFNIQACHFCTSFGKSPRLKYPPHTPNPALLFWWKSTYCCMNPCDKDWYHVKFWKDLQYPPGIVILEMDYSFDALNKFKGLKYSSTLWFSMKVKT